MSEIKTWLEDVVAVKTWTLSEEGLTNFKKSIKEYLISLNSGQSTIDTKVYQGKDFPVIILIISGKNNVIDPGKVVGILKVIDYQADELEIDKGNVFYIEGDDAAEYSNEKVWGTNLKPGRRDQYIYSDDPASLKRFVRNKLQRYLDNNSNKLLIRGNNKMKIENAIESNRQVIFTGAPGTGKTFSVRKYVEVNTAKYESKYKFVQFHASYDYTDFVEGLRPVPDGSKGNMFVRMDGTFKAFCRDIVEDNLIRLEEFDNRITSIDTYLEYMKTLDDENKRKVYQFLDEKPYYFIIDEINRADLSRVFGELMFGLEESYREVHNRFDTQYKNLVAYCMNEMGEAIPINDDCFKDGFFVPYNLYIIGTMNDIDRSVESFDFALRRRFIWIDIKANEVMFESLKAMRDQEKNDELSDDSLENVVGKIKKMNMVISDAGLGLTEAYHIGPAYFKDLVTVSDNNVEGKLREIFNNRIEPILYEYTRGRRVDITSKLIHPCKTALGI